MLRSANELLMSSCFVLALCGACEQGGGGSPEGKLPVDPGTAAAAAGSAAQASTEPAAASAANDALPGVLPGAAPGAGSAAAPGSSSPHGGQRTDAPAAADPVTGLPTGPALPVDPLAVQFERFIPTDARTPVQALGAAPISGGTLLITADGFTAVAADPDRDRVSIADLTTGRLLANVALQAGDEPGRMVQDSFGRVHVALRRGGAVATIDLFTRTVVSRRAVCASPRGIAFDPGAQMLQIACVGGELVSLPANSGEVAARAQVQADLRDVVLTAGGSFVSRLKRAELLKLDSAGAISNATRPVTGSFFFPEPDGSSVVDTLEPVAARRTIASLDGGLLMLHQGARNGDIEVSASDNLNIGVSSSPYGGSGSGSCTGVVTTSLTHFDGSGRPLGTVELPGVLAVDVAESPLTAELAVAFAGVADPVQPIAQVVTKGAVLGDGTVTGGDVALEVGSVMQFERALLDQPSTFGQPVCLGPIGVVSLPAPATALAYAGDRLVVQTREPAALFIVDSALDNQGRERVQIDLGGASVRDTGHEIFHRDAGAGVACASCHVEGGDDGHVWHFVDQGARRTQSMLVGLEGTAPFHWVGDMTDLGTLMENVFVGRMGGVHQSTERLTGLEQWLYAIERPPALRDANDPAAVRGKELFIGQAECATCHNGPKLTNNQTVDVGTGLPLQVPSLVGIAYRGPWIHTGCAATLRDRFDPACGGGDLHGKTSQLSSAQIDDLVAFLQTL